MRGITLKRTREGTSSANRNNKDRNTPITSRSTSQSDSIVRQTNKRPFQSKVDLEIILVARFCKETRRRRLVMYVDLQTIIQ